MTADELRAHIDEYAATFDETIKTRFDCERFLGWLKAKTEPAQAAQTDVQPAE